MQIKSTAACVPGYVYMIGSDEFCWYKIGFSKSCDIRSEQLGVLLPFKVELFAAWKSYDARGLEKEMHHKYAALHIHGEWFGMSWQVRDALIADVQEIQCKLIFPASGLVVKRAISSSCANSATGIKSSGWKAKRKESQQKFVVEWLRDHNLKPTKENLHMAWKEAVLEPQKQQKYELLDSL